MTSDIITAFDDFVQTMSFNVKSKIYSRRKSIMPNKKDVIGTVVGATVGAAVGFGVAHFVLGNKDAECACDGECCADATVTDETEA